MGGRNVIVGTAGHIDHGKSALVEKLTGVHPDRFREEQERGITLDLGFAGFEINGTTISFVDVPGHEKLIKNMIAGATGIDMVMFAIDAAEGIKPQTVEHADILSVLNIEILVVVLTKADKVDDKTLELRIAEIKDFFAKFSYKYKKFLPTSIYDESSLENLRQVLYESSKLVKRRITSEYFLMRIDRSFTVRGAGTVVTGSCITGRAEVNKTIEILPSHIKAKIRSIQVHSRNSGHATAGYRAALNLAGVNKNNIKRGDIAASPGVFTTTKSFYAHIKSFASINKHNVIKHNRTYRFLIGTYAGEAKIILPGKKSLDSGESALCKINLQYPYAPLFNEAFFLRALSPQVTVAGGNMISLNSFGLEKEKLTEYLSFMEKKEYENALKILESNIRSVFEIPGFAQFAEDEPKKLNNLLNKYFILKDGTAVSKKYYNDILNKAEESIISTDSTLLSNYKIYFANSESIWEIFKRDLLVFAENNGYTFENDCIFKKKKTEHQIIADKIYEEMGKDLSLSNKKNIADFLNISEQAAGNALTILLNADKLKKIDDKNFIRKDLFESFLRQSLKTAKEDSYIDLTKAKKLINAPRKILVPLMEQLDKTKLFVNKDNKRYLK